MSNDYVAKMLIDQRLADLRQEAEQERLARLVRRGQPQRRHWWERLMLSRSHSDTGSPAAEAADARRPSRRQHHSVTVGSVRS